MKIIYDNLGRVSEVKFDEGENQELGFKAFETLVKEQAAASKYAMDKNAEAAKYNAEANKYAADKNLEANVRVMEYNYAMASLKFNNQLKPCKVDNDPTKGIELTT